mmetsp:Transcript_31345/g.40331  ORF Transcript_31345/g.40331 Transcript_31345/m.40331 type:complete len:187 (+) Transcript_31345:167-727(+)
MLAAMDVSEDVKELIEQLKILGWKERKPWNEFFDKFKAPKSWTYKHLEERITTNFLHYRSNYALIFTIIICAFIITNPGLLLSIFSCAGIFIYFVPTTHRVVRIGDKTFNQKEGILIASAGSTALLFLTGGFYKLLLIISVAGGVCVVHMIFRPRNISSKANRIFEETKLNVNKFQQQNPQLRQRW